MKLDDEALRSKRVVFYKDTVDQIDVLLKEFLKLSNAKCVYLIDKEGHLITETGQATDANPETLSALIAGSFSATKELARVLGESEFTTMSHKGKKDNITITLVGERSMIAVLFDEKTTTGMVDLYSKELAEKISKILDISQRQQAIRSKETLHKDYGESVQSKLDELFED